MRHLFIFLYVFSIPAFADVYKCTDANGRPVYQQSPCAGEQEKIAIYKCANSAGQASFFRGHCPKGFSGAPSDEWIEQSWVQKALKPLIYKPDRQQLLDNPDWFYPDWTDIGIRGAAHGLTLKRIKDCVDNHEYTSDLRPGVAAEGCISDLRKD